MNEIDSVLEEILNRNYSRIIFNEEKILRKLSDITLKELRTLEVISKGEKNNRNTSTFVAKSLGITLGTLTANIDRLIKKNLVVREKSEEDKRATVLLLTPEGRKVLKSYNNEHLAIIRNALKNLSDKEKVIIVNLVNKFDV